VPSGCPVTTGIEFLTTASYILRGITWPALDRAIAMMPATVAQEAEVPPQTSLASGPVIAEGNVSDLTGKNRIDEHAPVTSTPKANSSTVGP
jgi:hypothetical protein